MRVRLGPIVNDARGTLGDLVYSIWKAGVHYVRTKPDAPSNPDTDLQQLMRDAKGNALTEYAALTAAQKSRWEEYAQSFARRNQDLDQGGGTANLVPHHRPPLSGQNAFVQAYLRLARAYLNNFDAAPLEKQPCMVEDLAVVWDAANNELDVTWTDPGASVGSDTNYFSETFEDETPPALPNAWTPAWVYNQPGTSIIRASNVQAHGGTVSCQISPGTLTATASYGVAALATVEGIVVDYYLYPTNATNNQAVLLVTDAAVANTVISARLLAGWLQVWTGAALTNIIQHSVNAWDHVRYVLHPSTRTFDLYYNDMSVALLSGLAYRNNVDAGALYISNSSAAQSFLDDINIFSSTALLRLWLLSYQAAAHKQLLIHEHVFLEEMHPTTARYAAGVVDLLDNNHGLYYIQADVLATDEERNGLLSVPSKIFRIDVN